MDSSVPTDEWGPKAWARLHATARQYPQHPSWHDRRAADEFLTSFTESIPCASCRRHFEEMTRPYVVFQYSSKIFDSSDEFFGATVEWHNRVNERIGKPRVSLEYAKKLYPRRGHKRKSGCDDMLLFLVACAGIAALSAAMRVERASTSQRGRIRLSV